MDDSVETDPQKTHVWWRLLSSIAVFNCIAWAVTFFVVDASSVDVRRQLVLSGIYTAVCAFRSFLPRIDLERTVLVDSPLSSVALGRSAATVAEVSFAAQVGLFVAEVGDRAGFAWFDVVGVIVVVLLSTAQLFCWSSVITLSHLGHAVEESLWAIVFTMVGVCLALSAGRTDGVWHVVTVVGSVAAAGYVGFMVVIDVPMYLRRWRKSLRDGDRRLGFVDGLKDAAARRHPTRSWAVWRPEVGWLTGYFTFAVWLSLALVHLPR